MANQINWGKIYCDMETNDGWGLDEQYTLVPVTPFTADMISYFGGNLTADNAVFKADKTQL